MAIFTVSFLCYFTYRLSSIVIVQTSYVPDEYWQSLEVAHFMAFGYGYLTWEWKHGLRTYLYPFIFFVPYKILQLLNLDNPCSLISIPKVIQAFLTALSDRYFLLLCAEFNYDEYWSNLVVLTNWFWYYCGFRTITNTFETSVTIIALYFYPWNIFIRGRQKIMFFEFEVKARSLVYLSLAMISCLIRPTSVTIWLPLVALQISTFTRRYTKKFILKCILPVTIVFVPISLFVDYIYYGKFIVPAYNFFMFNVMKDISSFYGTHPFTWYLVQGLPVVLGVHFIPFVLGCVIFFAKIIFRVQVLHRKVYFVWLFILVLNIIILSNIPHKEFRFLLPLMPLMMLIVISTLTQFVSDSNQILKLIWTVVSIIGFIVPVFLFGMFHQRGALSLMSYLRNSVQNCQPHCFFLILMPCHTTPLYSHLHTNVKIKFLTCDPPLEDNHYDESEHFFRDPDMWLTKFWSKSIHPTHVAFFDSIESKISKSLSVKGFKKSNEFLHTFFPLNKTGNYIVVYEVSTFLKETLASKTTSKKFR